MNLIYFWPSLLHLKKLVIYNENVLKTVKPYNVIKAFIIKTAVLY